jgi:hypothetical protein
MESQSWQTCRSRCLLLILALAWGQEPARGWSEEGPGEKAWKQHLRELADRLPSRDFHVVPVAPFVVIGDEPPAQVERRAQRTVQWAVSRLQRDFFPRDPQQTIDIWLLKDADSYRKHSRQLFGINPSTPFGYFSQPHQALVMNISTGGGTLVHELVHPLMAANFPQCPAWFDEGLASLYEQCGDREGRIWGYTNWRLRGLQRAIRAGRVPSFKQLCHTSPREFYGEDEGSAVYYAQARYLCYYLQEKGKLREFYRRFRNARRRDPAGYDTLCEVLQEPDMQQFQQRWEKFVLQLKFPAGRSAS